MEIMSYTQLRLNLSAVMDKVNQNHTPIIITRQNNKPVVVMSLEDFNSYDETNYLMSNPINALKIKESIEAAEKGLLEKQELFEV